MFLVYLFAHHLPSQYDGRRNSSHSHYHIMYHNISYHIISYHITDTSPEYLAHRDGINKESACEKCIEMESQL